LWSFGSVLLKLGSGLLFWHSCFFYAKITALQYQNKRPDTIHDDTIHAIHTHPVCQILLVANESMPDGGKAFVEGLPISASFGKRSKGISWYYYGRTGTG
jgi:hypothetical protein